eukprot:4808428-Amphidinium_carterae.4
MDLARQLPHVKIQTARQYSHQSQGIVERYHQTLFAQLRTIKFRFCQQWNIEQRQISSHSPLINHILHGDANDAKHGDDPNYRKLMREHDKTFDTLWDNCVQLENTVCQLMV